MKILKGILALFVLASLFVACSTTRTSEAIVSAKDGKGVLFIYRPKNDIWRYKRFNLYINGEYENLLRNGRYIALEKRSGKYLIELREDTDVKPKIYSVKATLRANKTKYFRFGVENIESHLKLKSVRKFQAVGEDDLYKKAY